MVVSATRGAGILAALALVTGGGCESVPPGCTGRGPAFGDPPEARGAALAPEETRGVSLGEGGDLIGARADWFEADPALARHAAERSVLGAHRDPATVNDVWGLELRT